MFGAEEVGAPGGAVQHRATGEDSMDGAPGVAQHIADVVVGVAGGVDDLQLDGAGVDDVTVLAGSRS